MQNYITSSTRPVQPQNATIQGRWPRMLRRPAVAEYLSVSDRYVDALVDAGYIPGPKLAPSSRCVLWDRVEIDQWLDDSIDEPNDSLRSFDDIMRSPERA